MQFLETRDPLIHILLNVVRKTDSTPQESGADPAIKLNPVNATNSGVFGLSGRRPDVRSGKSKPTMRIQTTLSISAAWTLQRVTCEFFTDEMLALFMSSLWKIMYLLRAKNLYSSP
jgi:hypothetical protein